MHWISVSKINLKRGRARVSSNMFCVYNIIIFMMNQTKFDDLISTIFIDFSYCLIGLKVKFEQKQRIRDGE